LLSVVSDDERKAEVIPMLATASTTQAPTVRHGCAAHARAARPVMPSRRIWVSARESIGTRQGLTLDRAVHP
jgi:hypothetical protein